MKVCVFSNGGELQHMVCSILDGMNIEISDVVSDPVKGKNLKDANVLVSICYKCKIDETILSRFPLSINFHPAPLPHYKGFAVYNFALYNEESHWGVTAHHMTDQIDCGDIIEVSRFDIANETVNSLREKSHSKLLSLFKSVIGDIKNGKSLNREKNIGGKNYSKRMFNEFREIKATMSSHEVDKRIHAFNSPPHKGAFIVIDDKKYYFNL